MYERIRLILELYFFTYLFTSAGYSCHRVMSEKSISLGALVVYKY